MRFSKVLFIYLLLLLFKKMIVWLDWSLRWKEWYNLKTLILLAHILWSFRPLIPLVIVFYSLSGLWSYDGTLTMKNCSLKCPTFLSPCFLLLAMWSSIDLENSKWRLPAVFYWPEGFWFGGFWISLFSFIYIYIYILLFFSTQLIKFITWGLSVISQTFLLFPTSSIYSFLFFMPGPSISDRNLEDSIPS